MSPLDPETLRVLTYLADRYRPVSSDWVETQSIAGALGLPIGEINSRCQMLIAQGLIELSPPDEEHESYAAIVTTKGLRLLGRGP